MTTATDAHLDQVLQHVREARQTPGPEGIPLAVDHLLGAVVGLVGVVRELEREVGRAQSAAHAAAFPQGCGR